MPLKQVILVVTKQCLVRLWQTQNKKCSVGHNSLYSTHQKILVTTIHFTEFLTSLTSLQVSKFLRLVFVCRFWTLFWHVTGVQNDDSLLVDSSIPAHNFSQSKLRLLRLCFWRFLKAAVGFHRFLQFSRLLWSFSVWHSLTVCTVWFSEGREVW